MAPYDTIVGLLWLTFVVVWIVTATKAKPSVPGSHRRGAGYRLILFPIALLIVFGTRTVVGLFGIQLEANHDVTLAQIGVVLVAIGFAFAFWARFTLGRNWGMPMSIRQKPELVTSGPYRLVRHPIYTGMLLAMLGASLTVGSYWFVALIIFGVYFIFSATQEEKTMAGLFPEAYPAYRRRSKMLIPYLF
jgi:protein-S-isoprenylcysteine O-methyltransferase Ste14